jgi:hypothetical protein
MTLNIIGSCRNSEKLKNITKEFQQYDDFKTLSEEETINVLVSDEPQKDVQVWYTENKQKVNYLSYYSKILKDYQYRYLVVKNVQKIGHISTHIIFYKNRVQHYTNEDELNLSLIDLLGNIQEL